MTTRTNYIPMSTTAEGAAKYNLVALIDDVSGEGSIGLNGFTHVLVGCIFTQTNTVTVSGTVAETSLIGTGIGSVTLPANFWAVGKTVRVKMLGIHTMPGGSPTMQIKLKLGAVTLGDTTALVDKNDTNTLQEFEALITCRTTGATGTVMCNGRMLHHEGTSDVSMWPFENTTTSTIDTTASAALDLTVQVSTATGTSISSTNLIIEVLN
jgi:hypothetical protein